MFKIDMAGKTIVITGASQGIGAAISEVFAESGAALILLSRNKEKLERNIKQFKNAKYFILDISKENDVEKIFKEIGQVDVLINNAGVYFTSPFQALEIKKWKELLDINLNGAMYCTRQVIEKMIKNKYGRIINISSVCGKTGEPFASAYSASKFALIGFTQSLALEVADKNITVNAICPGWTETQMAENILSDEKYAKLHGIPKEELKKVSFEAIPIGRCIHPKEVGYLALYLASNHASAITGQSINICGGICMH